jgi:copper resistance protein D
MYQWAVFIHLILVAFWLGGMLFTVAVLVPATRKGALSSQKGLLFRELGSRFSRLSWLIFPLLLLTGILALFGRGFDSATLMSGTFWSSEYGTKLSSKLSLFAGMMVISGMHDFWLGPEAARRMEEGREDDSTNRLRLASRWAGRINLLIGLAILFFAVSLVR